MEAIAKDAKTHFVENFGRLFGHITKRGSQNMENMATVLAIKITRSYCIVGNIKVLIVILTNCFAMQKLPTSGYTWVPYGGRSNFDLLVNGYM